MSPVRLLSGLIERLSSSVNWLSPSSLQFYELRLMFLITALRPELSTQLQQVRQPKVTLRDIFLNHQESIPSCPVSFYFPLSGGRLAHPYYSLGELPGGAVEGPV